MPCARWQQCDRFVQSQDNLMGLFEEPDDPVMRLL